MLTPMKVYSYIRVSGKGQVGGEGPDRQRDECSRFCQEHNCVSIGEFFDAGVTGTISDRPAFSDMIESIQCRRANGETIDGFVIERMDRLARDLMVSELLLSECRKLDIKVFTADQGLIDLASNDVDPTRKLIRQFMAALAEFEKSNMVIKLRKAREAIRRREGRCEGAKPYGQTPEERAVLKVLQLFVSKDSKLEEVASLLNREGLRTRHGGTWTAKSAFRIMKIAGVWQRKPTADNLKNLGNYAKQPTAKE